MYLIIDTETGGIDPKNSSLLTLFIAAVDEQSLEVVATCDLAIKHDVYKVTGEALRINNINIADHDLTASPLEEVIEELRAFLRVVSTHAKGEQLIPVGQNIAFDIGFIKEGLPGLDWSKYVSYRVLDTQVIARFLQRVGKLPSDMSLSLRRLAEHYGVEDTSAHTAKGDVLVTLEVLRGMINGSR